MRTLYVTWDGPGSNYLESLFLPIFDRLKQQGTIDFDVLQFAWQSKARTESIARFAGARSISYECVGVPSGPQALVTLASILRGGALIARRSREQRIDFLMPRSIIPAAMSLIAMRLRPSLHLIYDADGLMADERVDFGGWSSRGARYQLFSATERTAVRHATAVLTRTVRAKQILAERSRRTSPDETIFVAGNGKNESMFTPGSAETRRAIRAQLGISSSAPLIAYAGSWGTQYYPSSMMRLFTLVAELRTDAHLLVLTSAVAEAEAAADEARIDPSTRTIMAVGSSEVPELLASADLGMALRAPSPSQRAVAPIKVGEYLLCGLPILSTRGVGDLDTQLDDQVGRLLDAVNEESLRSAAAWFIDSVLPHRDAYRERSRKQGLQHYSLSVIVEAYRRAFDYAESTVAASRHQAGG